MIPKFISQYPPILRFTVQLATTNLETDKSTRTFSFLLGRSNMERSPGLRASAPTFQPGLALNHHEEATAQIASHDGTTSLMSTLIVQEPSAPSIPETPAEVPNDEEEDFESPEKYIYGGPAANALRAVHQGIFTSQEAADDFQARLAFGPIHSQPIRIEPLSSASYSTIPTSRFNTLEHAEAELGGLQDENKMLKLLEAKFRPQIVKASDAFEASEAARESLLKQLAAVEKENEELRQRAQTAERRNRSDMKTARRNPNETEKAKSDETKHKFEEAVKKRAEAAKAEAEAAATISKKNKGKRNQWEEAAEGEGTEAVRGQQETASSPPKIPTSPKTDTPPKTPKPRFVYLEGGGMCTV
ncbi:hypothetical protein VTL71DRAFT_15309 [Oculimacula yallundae]|uniref:Uncharacterized protein n=1 Tax=Oculimacula yallundae TaxID=86028 RepID=A0ABR4CI99_9HELO